MIQKPAGIPIPDLFLYNSIYLQNQKGKLL